jgi:hypothetical protein
MSKLCPECHGEKIKLISNNDGLTYSAATCDICNGTGYSDLTPDYQCGICGEFVLSGQHDGMACMAAQASKVPGILKRIERLERMHNTSEVPK